MHVTIPQLVMVDAICKEGTVTAAAHRLAVTQPALSHRLREPESQLDLKLFRRDGSRMTVTREGERVARSARAVVEELARLRHDLGQLHSGYQGVLRIATECYTCYDWLPVVLERFAATFPGVEVQILPEATRDPIKPLVDGTLDVAIVYTLPHRDDLALKPLFRDEVVAVVPRSHPFAARRYLTARDFRDQCLICHFPELERTVLAREVLRPAGVTPARVHAVQLTGAVLAMVGAKRGITVIPRWVLGKERSSRHFRAVRITRSGLFRVWYAAMRVENATLPALTKLVEVLGGEAPRAVARDRRRAASAMSERGSRALVVAAVLALAPAVRGRDTRPADMQPYTETVPGTSVTFDMVPLAGGTFRMGSPATEAGRAEDEGPPHEVTLGPFWIGKFEVTWSEYDRFWLDAAVAQASYPSEIRAAGVDALTRPTPPYADESFGFGKGRQPVISVGHHAAMEYARWLSRKTGKVYRLPTEAEWEYACRAGTTTAYSFGNDPAALGEHAWSAGNSGAQPRPVGGKKPNPWGIFDIHGNAGEWVLDLYRKDAYRTRATTPAVAPVVMPTERIYPHVVRGGSWDHDAPALRCAARLASHIGWNRRDPQRPQSIWWLTDATFVGFRLVRPLEEQKELIGLRSRVTKESP